MPWNDWTPITSAAHMKIEYIQKAYENQAYIHDLIVNLLGTISPLNIISTVRGTAQQPFPAYINLLEDNLHQLSTPTSAPSWTPQAPASKTWLGELMDQFPLDFQDVNRWFSTLKILKEELESITQRYLISGTFSSSGDGEAQHIRRA